MKISEYKKGSIVMIVFMAIILLIILVMPTEAVELDFGECINKTVITNTTNVTTEYCSPAWNNSWNKSYMNISRSKLLKLELTENSCSVYDGDNSLSAISRTQDTGSSTFNISYLCLVRYSNVSSGDQSFSTASFESFSKFALACQTNQTRLALEAISSRAENEHSREVIGEYRTQLNSTGEKLYLANREIGKLEKELESEKSNKVIIIAFAVVFFLMACYSTFMMFRKEAPGRETGVFK